MMKQNFRNFVNIFKTDVFLIDQHVRMYSRVVGFNVVLLGSNTLIFLIYEAVVMDWILLSCMIFYNY